MSNCPWAKNRIHPCPLICALGVWMSRSATWEGERDIQCKVLWVVLETTKVPYKSTVSSPVNLECQMLNQCCSPAYSSTGACVDFLPPPCTVDQHLVRGSQQQLAGHTVQYFKTNTFCHLLCQIFDAQYLKAAHLPDLKWQFHPQKSKSMSCLAANHPCSPCRRSEDGFFILWLTFINKASKWGKRFLSWWHQAAVMNTGLTIWRLLSAPSQARLLTLFSPRCRFMLLRVCVCVCGLLFCVRLKVVIHSSPRLS